MEDVFKEERLESMYSFLQEYNHIDSEQKVQEEDNTNDFTYDAIATSFDKAVERMCYKHAKTLLFRLTNAKTRKPFVSGGKVRSEALETLSTENTLSSVAELSKQQVRDFIRSMSHKKK